MPHYYHMQIVNGSTLPRPPHSLILKPQVPKHPHVDINEDVIEDDFTPRVSLGATVADCVHGLTTGDGYYELYRTVENNLDLEQPHTSGPSTPDMDYGPNFVFADYIEYLAGKYPKLNFENVYSPSGLPPRFRDEFEGCVPDASETNEYWSRKPVRVQYMGVINTRTGHIAEPEATSVKLVARKLRAFLAELDGNRS